MLLPIKKGKLISQNSLIVKRKKLYLCIDHKLYFHFSQYIIAFSNIFYISEY